MRFDGDPLKETPSEKAAIYEKIAGGIPKKKNPGGKIKRERGRRRIKNT